MEAKNGLQVMRKGTRACVECRRRKLKCIYPTESSLCTECAEHNRQCVCQGVVIPAEGSSRRKQKLRVRVSRLESMVERLAQPHTDQQSDIPGSLTPPQQSGDYNTVLKSHRYTLEDLQELDATSQMRSPLSALLDNDTLWSKSKTTQAPFYKRTSVSFGPAEISERDKLLSVIAVEPHIMKVVDLASGWWVAWEDQLPGVRELGLNCALVNFVSSQLAEESFIKVTLGLLCIAMSLQHLRPGVDDTGIHLSSSVQELKENVLVAIDGLVLDKQSQILSMDGIFALLLRGKIHAEANQVRKSWLRIRQAIQVSQDLGLANLQSADLSPGELLQRQRLVGGLFEVDRSMSLVLGLPYVVDPYFVDSLAWLVLSEKSDLSLKVRALRRIVGVAAGRTSDRNAKWYTCQIGVTQKIQKSLDDAKTRMPQEWWDPLALTVQMAANPRDLHDHLMAQFLFYQTETMVQLPYLLRYTNHINSSLSPDRCVAAARQQLVVYHALIHDPRLSIYTCRCEDFQALLAAIIVVLGMLEDVNEGSVPSPLDLDLIETTKDILRYESTQQGGMIARQGLQVLDALTSFLDDDQTSSADLTREQTLFVPYFGTITVQYIPHVQKGGSLLETTNLTQQLPTPTSSTNEDINGANMPSRGVDLVLGGQSQPHLHDQQSTRPVPAQYFLGISDAHVNRYDDLAGPQSASSGWEKGATTDVNGGPEIDLNLEGGAMSLNDYNFADSFLFGDELGMDWNKFDFGLGVGGEEPGGTVDF